MKNIIILLTILLLCSCNHQKYPIDSLHKQGVSLLENPLDSLLSQFMDETSKSSRYFIFIYQSSKGIVFTFRTNNIDYQINNKIQPVLIGRKNGKTLYFYTGIEHLIKFDTIRNCTDDCFKRNSHNISKSYIVYDVDNHTELIKKGSIPPYAPPPDKIIELKN